MKLYTDYKSVAQFAGANKQAGHHYFSKDTLKFFNQTQESFKILNVDYPGLHLQFAYDKSLDESIAMPIKFFIDEKNMERTHGKRTATTDHYMLKVSSVLLHPDGTTGSTTEDYTFFGSWEECINKEWEKEAHKQLKDFAHQVYNLWLCVNNEGEAQELIQDEEYMEAVKFTIKACKLDYDYKVWSGVRDILETQHGDN